jgi:hypothetical protein
MLCGFALADEDDGDIQAVSLLQHQIVIDVYLAQNGTELAEQRGDGGFRFLAKMASGTRVERDVARAGSGKAGVFGMSAHRLRAKLHLTGERAPLGRTGA